MSALGVGLGLGLGLGSGRHRALAFNGREDGGQSARPALHDEQHAGHLAPQAVLLLELEAEGDLAW